MLAAARDLGALAEPGMMSSFDAATLKTRDRYVLKVPRCTVCGRRAQKPERTIRDLA